MKITPKLLSNSILFLMVFIFSSCSVFQRVHYVGDTFSPREQVDTYYDKADIESDYKTMGHLISVEFVSNKMLRDIQRDMIREAQKRGADAIVFAPFEISADQRNSDDLRLKAQLIRYTLD
jgi:hypothetical protein